MAMDMFIKIGKLVGESTDSVHKDKIDVLAWSWGVSNSGTTHQGGGGGSGKANFQDLNITKYIDKSSTELISSAANGTHHPEALLIIRKSGGKAPIEYLKIKMEEVLISNFTTGGSGGEDRLTEHLTLNFAKVTVDYTPQKPDGTPDKTLNMTWDIAANVK